MKLYGKAKLTLRDATSGRILREEEHKNTVTEALEKIFGSNIAGQLNYNKLIPIFEKLLGGVVLLNGTVDSESIFLPSADNATLTAHAGQNTTGFQTDTRKGTPDTEHTGDVPNGYKFTWFWGSSKGNGTISDICLTHVDTGDFWSENSDNVMEDNFCPVEYVGNDTISAEEFFGAAPLNNQEKIPVGFWEDINHVVSIELETRGTRVDTAGETVEAGGVIVHISKWTGSGVWIWNNLAEPYEDDSFYIELPMYQWGNFEEAHVPYYFAYDQTAKKMYWIGVGRENIGWADQYLPTSKAVKITTIDLTAKTATTTDVDLSTKLDTDEWIYAPSIVYDPLQLQVVNGSIFLTVFNSTDDAFTDKSIKLQLSNNAATVVSGFTEESESNMRFGNCQIELGEGRLMNPCSMAHKNESGNYTGLPIKYDSNLFHHLREDRYFITKQPTANPVQYITAGGINTQAMDTKRGCILNKLYQATVYHLSEPVTKTAAMTMTLEYTITQEEIQP